MTNNTDFIINATLQLQKDFDYICYQYKLKLKRPTIIIEQLSRTFGKWDETRRIIFISEDLIYQYSWEKVLSILKHEMAHQIVSEIFYDKDIHGPSFLRATTLIGLDKEYAQPQISLEHDCLDWKKRASSDEDKSIFRKVEKLLNLSNSSNEHESYLAMAKVREIYQKYNIHRVLNKSQNQYVSLTMNLRLKRIPSKVFSISGILQEHFFISPIFSKIYCIKTNQEFRSLVIMGERHNVLMAEYVYEFLIKKVESLWSAYQKNNKFTFKFKISYQKGVLEGFSKKLEEQKSHLFNSNTNQEKQITLSYHKKLASYVKTQFPKTSSVNQSGLIYKDHYDSGSEAGKKITLTRPISQKNATSILKFLKPGAHK